MSTKNIRNFSIIAHIDHGKSTLADRMLEMTNTVSSREMRDQFLDKIQLERERGITIKLQTVRMQYKPNPDSETYFLNLIDTPGHIDFSYEVSRSLAACEGAILLVDASQGIQAQTIANYIKAEEAGLRIIPVVNKIDLPTSHPETVALDLMESFGFSESEIVFASGKTGEGVIDLLNSIISQIPAPIDNSTDPLRALVFDSYYDTHKGVMAIVRIVDGSLSKKELKLINANQTFEPIEIGFLTSHLQRQEIINTGEVGYIATGLKDIQKVRVGDTVTIDTKNNSVKPLPGYREPKAMVYANIFPEDASEFNKLREAVEKYNLTDAAFTYEPVNSPVLGAGFNCGFLGLLHLDVVRQRLESEHLISTQITLPNVVYYIKLRNGKEITVKSPQEFPEPNLIQDVTEPWCKVQIFSQNQYIGNLIKVSEDHRGEFVNMQHLSKERIELEYRIPLSEVISNFFDQVKSVSAGYASLDYEVVEYRPVKLVRLDIQLNYQPQEALSRLVVELRSHEIAKKMVEKLKEVLPPQQFKVPIQAMIGGNVIARETLPSLRKNVTEKLYGGDRTRKDKLLKKQAAGKKRMQEQGRVRLPHNVYQQIITLS